ncbi:hypothetical protein [Streptomyces dysideae]|uniref:Uncharacterized protein n=1 Tax=Streptomyces dysideae TaxID=909626 RepID=A0A101V0W0_9ACTN|nr:hypothetical protein [Streptomyces dysideae]KUO20471.1 hypothetical protein AQJ91_13940 [Streptomyces dysideae]
MKSQLSSQTSPSPDELTETPGESSLDPLLTAWDLTHPALADPEWRHLLDEIAHPRTTRAFQRLAQAGA